MTETTYRLFAAKTPFESPIRRDPDGDTVCDVQDPCDDGLPIPGATLVFDEVGSCADTTFGACSFEPSKGLLPRE